MGSAWNRLPRGPWWKRLKLTPAMGVAIAVLAGGFFIAKQLHGPQAAPQGNLRVNLNTATLAELESIPGVGKVIAGQIVENRPYQSVDDLLKIRGIGPSSLKALAPYVKVEGETEKLR